MFLLLILPILASGFIFCQIHPIHKNKLYRYEGQFLYLKCVQYGFFFLCLSVVLLLTTNGVVSYPVSLTSLSFEKISILGLINKVISQNSPLTDKKQLVIFCDILYLSSLMLIFPFVLSFLSFLRLSIKYKSFKYGPFILATILKDSPLDSLLFGASLGKGKDISVMLSLSDRKIYVGKIASMGEPSETKGPDQEIEMIPLMSGYRDKDTLTVKFTTHYNLLDDDVILVIKQDEINSATLFSFRHYEIFEKSKVNKKNLLDSLIAFFAPK
ncbi:hypothetical protein [Klebsiella michiganensis]|uniref:hypothetical protein n=1 Tax=Klebsiella michiganensis TaxID=1134687 RepID=UPI0025400790|nr:hypothetical protein [Klebsiella michiganensis]MDK3052662.1 hypothetical protein [Klebsiella michiganensis]